MGSDNKFFYYLGCLTGLVVGFALMYFYTMPRLIERRGKEIGIYRYDGDKDKFVPKDSVTINQWEIHYLQYGNLELDK